MATTHSTNTIVVSFEESPSRMKAPLWTNDSAAGAYAGATTWIAIPGSLCPLFGLNANKAH